MIATVNEFISMAKATRLKYKTSMSIDSLNRVRSGYGRFVKVGEYVQFIEWGKY